MKTIKLLLLCCMIQGLNHAQNPPKLYIQFVSHNEDNFAYLNSVNNYMAARNNLKTVGLGFQSRNVKWNLGSDYILLKAALKYDTNSVLNNTNGKNILRYLKEDLGVECDPHSHEARYNYGTIAWLHTQLGVTPSNIMSGFLWNVPQSGHWWYDYQNGSVSDSVPSYTWNPDVMWGAAVPQHTADPEYWGLWKPKDVAGFTTHQAANKLIYCSQGCRIKVDDNTQVMDVVNAVAAAISTIQTSAPSNGIYNTSIFFGEGKISQPIFRQKLFDISDSLAKYVTQGKLEWRTITDVTNYWKTSYAAQPFMLDCDFTTVGTNENSLNESGVITFPNPASNFLHIRSSYAIESVVIYDMNGKAALVKDGLNVTAPISVSSLSPGLYLLQLKTDAGTLHKKILVGN